MGRTELNRTVRDLVARSIPGLPNVGDVTHDDQGIALGHNRKYPELTAISQFEGVGQG